MDDNEHSVMVALLPINDDWCKIALPHLTLVYAGNTSELRPTDFNELGKQASETASKFGPIQLTVTGVEVFGEEPDRVQVLTFANNAKLAAIQLPYASWSVSKFPFNPHATIGPVGSFVPPAPPAVAFDRIGVFWGEDSMVFYLKP
jgi:2'-5' RNA ligase